jgi:hypothetical protein
MKDSTKTKIDAMTIDELSYQIELGHASPYQREKMAYIKSRHTSLKEQESSQRHHENITTQKASAEANKPVSPIINTWWSYARCFDLYLSCSSWYPFMTVNHLTRQIQPTPKSGAADLQR